MLRHAIADYQDWEWWYKDVVGGKYLLKAEGSTPGSTYLHGQEQCVRVAMNHPITAHIGAMHLWDETYKGMWISPDVKVLLRSDAPPVTVPWPGSVPTKNHALFISNLGMARARICILPTACWCKTPSAGPRAVREAESELGNVNCQSRARQAVYSKQIFWSMPHQVSIAPFR